jgi:hypothetical protein
MRKGLIVGLGLGGLVATAGVVALMYNKTVKNLNCESLISELDYTSESAEVGKFNPFSIHHRGDGYVSMVGELADFGEEDIFNLGSTDDKTGSEDFPIFTHHGKGCAKLRLIDYIEDSNRG